MGEIREEDISARNAGQDQCADAGTLPALAEVETWSCPICGGNDDDEQLMCEACGGAGMLGTLEPQAAGSRDDPGLVAAAPLSTRLSPEEIADFHARFISCNEGFAEPEGLIRPAPHIDTPILLSHGREKALDMLLERLREPWEKMNKVAAKKIDRILADRREADAAIMLLREELAAAERRLAAAAIAVKAEAYRYAESYPQSSDGRNTFVIFGDAAERIIASATQAKALGGAA